MAKCACGREMLAARGCRMKYIVLIDDTKVLREKVGQEGWVEPGQRCGDCGALYGYYHHAHCDIERCPICGMQLLSCECPIKAYSE